MLGVHERDKTKYFARVNVDSLPDKCMSYVKRKFRPNRKINSHRNDTYLEMSCNYRKRYHIHYKTT